MSETKEVIRILAVDDDEDIIEIYRTFLCPEDENSDASTEPDEWNLLPGSLPIVDLETRKQGEEAIEAVQDARSEGRPYAIVFIDVQLPPGIDGVTAAEKIRRIDPEVQIVIATRFDDFHPDEVRRRIPPADRLFFVNKPLHPIEVQQFATALAARWRAESK